jgi:hypothetical protein
MLKPFSNVLVIGKIGFSPQVTVTIKNLINDMPILSDVLIKITFHLYLALQYSPWKVYLYEIFNFSFFHQKHPPGPLIPVLDYFWVYPCRPLPGLAGRGVDKTGEPREKKGRLEARRVPDIESLVDTVNRVHYIVILFLYSWSTHHITAG